MSSFEVKVRRVTILPHPDADRIELAQIDGYQSIVPKGDFVTGDLGVYIPEQAIVPEWILEEMQLVGKLAGPERNRVKAQKFRGVLSQGLFWSPAEFPLTDEMEGTDVAEQFGITKWVPPIPIELMGEVEPAPYGIFRTYSDIEDIKKFPDVLHNWMDVVISEKLHGTCCIYALVNGQRYVSSRGLAAKGLVIRYSPTNVYWRLADQHQLFEKLEQMAEDYGLDDGVILFGEGLGVQDLKYGLKQGEVDFRAFDLYSDARYWNFENFYNACTDFNIPMVPILYRGHFSREIMLEHTVGKSTLANHIREGVVVKTETEKHVIGIGRYIFKSISPDYLTRKGETTEFN